MSESTQSKLTLGSVVSFELHANGVLSNTYERVIVEGFIPASACSKYGYDVYALHADIFRQVPTGTMEDDAESYYYVLLKTQTDQHTVVGLPWIDNATIKVYKQQSAIFTVADIAQEDINVIRDVIRRYGYDPQLKVV